MSMIKNSMEIIKSNKNLFVMIMLSVVIITLGSSYALLRNVVTSSNPYTMTVGTLNVDFYGTTNSISLSNIAPMTDEEGLQQTNNVLNFTVKNQGDIQAEYDVYIDETSTNPAFKPVIRYSINKGDAGYGEVKSVEDNMLYIDKDVLLNSNGTANYKVKIWISETADNTYMNKTFTAKVTIASRQYDKTTITLNSTGGTGAPSSIAINKGATTYGTLPEPTYEGYTFLGWFTAATGGTEVTESTPFTYGSSTQTLYAQWEADTYTIACPGEGCYYTSTYNFNAAWYNPATTINPSNLPSNVSTNYNDVKTHYNAFLAFKLNNSNLIDHAYVCGISPTDPFCLEVTYSDNPQKSKIEEANINLLNQLYNTCTGTIASGFSCTSSYEPQVISISSNGTNYSVQMFENYKECWGYIAGGNFDCD